MQLYEAFLEGVVLFLILFALTRIYKGLRRPGLATGTFLILYAVFRIFVEVMFRDSDNKIPGLPHWFTVGVLFSAPMPIIGLLFLWNAFQDRVGKVPVRSGPCPAHEFGAGGETGAGRQMSLSPTEHLKRLIGFEGPQPVSVLMELALSHPREGYYTTQPGIGADLDFITAPEISQMFGELLGVFVLQTWFELGSPANWSLIELGPGSGRMAQDVIRTLRIRPQAFEGARLHSSKRATCLPPCSASGSAPPA